MDDSTDIMDYITESDDMLMLSGENSKQLQYEFKKFYSRYSDYDFTYVYDFRSDVESTLIEMLNQAMIEKGRQIEENTGFRYSYEVFSSDTSGIVSYYMDNYETVTRETVTKDMFDTSKYKSIPLRTTEMMAIDTPVYKIVTSETWSIIFPLTDEQYEKLQGKSTIEFTILNDNFTVSAPVSIYQNPLDSAYYAELTMDKYLPNYLK